MLEHPDISFIYRALPSIALNLFRLFMVFGRRKESRFQFRKKKSKSGSTQRVITVQQGVLLKLVSQMRGVLLLPVVMRVQT